MNLRLAPLTLVLFTLGFGSLTAQAQPGPGGAPPGYPPPGYPPPAPAYPAGAYGAAPIPRSGVNEHDGVFVRLLLGGGYNRMSTDVQGFEVNVSGGGVSSTIAVGGAVTPHIVIFGEAGGSNAINPDVEVTGLVSGQGEGSAGVQGIGPDPKSTRLNSSHLGISYAVFCLKKKTEVRSVRFDQRPADGAPRARAYEREERFVAEFREIDRDGTGPYYLLMSLDAQHHSGTEP